MDPILDQYLDGNPNQGVFSPINLNLTRYAGLNPVRITDPTGMSDCPECDEIMASRQKILDRVETVKEGMSTAGDVIEAVAPSPNPGSKVSGANKLFRAVAKLFKGKGDDVAKKAIQVPGRVQSRINVSNEGWSHTVKRHFSGKQNASQFSVSQDEVKELLGSKAVINSSVTRTVDSEDGIRYLREVDVGRQIGFDKMDGNNPTSVMTIMTDTYGNLVSTFPGVLK